MTGGSVAHNSSRKNTVLGGGVLPRPGVKSSNGNQNGIRNGTRKGNVTATATKTRAFLAAFSPALVCRVAMVTIMETVSGKAKAISG